MPFKYGYELPPTKNWDTEWSEFDSDYDKVVCLQDWYDDHVKEIESLAGDLYHVKRIKEEESKQHKEREESLLAEMEELEKEKDKLLEDCYNSEYVKKLEKNIKEYYNLWQTLESEIKELKEENEKLKKENKFLKEEIEGLKEVIDEEMGEKEEVEEKNEKLEKENEKLKNPVIPDRDARCSQFDVRVGYSYIRDCIEQALDALYLGEGYGEPEVDVDNLPNVVFDEIAKTIDKSINRYIEYRTGDNYNKYIHEYIEDDVLERLQELREEGLLEEEE